MYHDTDNIYVLLMDIPVACAQLAAVVVVISQIV